MTTEEKIYKIFHVFYYNRANEELIKELEKELKNHRFYNIENYRIMIEGKTANVSTVEIENNRKKYSDIMYSYNSILQNMTILSKELNLENSLELCLLFSYLLWNGYLSKNKEYVFSDKEIKRIQGLFFADIINGRGVCLNNSEMLKDFLNLNEYTSSMLMNHYNPLAKINYRIDLTRKKDDKKELLIITLIEELIRRRKANHVYNLIEDNNKLYIFDSTNMLMQKIIRNDKAEMVNGTGEFRLFPYQSHMLCASPDERSLLDKLLTTRQYEYLYTKRDLIITSEVCLEIIRNSTYLIENFYAEIKNNIDEISKETSKIKILTK